MKTFTNRAPEIGDTRVVRKFLILPRHFGRDRRWLEYADIVEKYFSEDIYEPALWHEVDFTDNRTKHIERIESRAFPDKIEPSQLPPTIVEQLLLDKSKLTEENRHLKFTLDHLEEYLRKKDSEIMELRGLLDRAESCVNSSPSPDTTKLLSDTKNLRATITHLQECLRKKNLELDALHHVWCSGGCQSGVHRYEPNNPDTITEELVTRAEANTLRLRQWFENRKSRLKDNPK